MTWIPQLCVQCGQDIRVCSGHAATRPGDGRLDERLVQHQDAGGRAAWARAEAAEARIATLEAALREAVERLDARAEGRVTPEAIRRQRDLGWPEFHPETYCHRCGGRNLTSWSVPSEMWNRAASPRDILCPQCWTRAYEAATGAEFLHWSLLPDAGLEARIATLEAALEQERGLRLALERAALALEEGYRAGAEAMREAIAAEVDQRMVLPALAQRIRAMPSPEPEVPRG